MKHYLLHIAITLSMITIRFDNLLAQNFSSGYIINLTSESDMFLMEDKMAGNIVKAGVYIVINTDYSEVTILDDSYSYSNKIFFEGEMPSEGQVISIHNSDDDDAYYESIEISANRTTHLLFLFGEWKKAHRNNEGGWDFDQ